MQSNEEMKAELAQLKARFDEEIACLDADEDLLGGLRNRMTKLAELLDNDPVNWITEPELEEEGYTELDLKVTNSPHWRAYRYAVESGHTAYVVYFENLISLDLEVTVEQIKQVYATQVEIEGRWARSEAETENELRDRKNFEAGNRSEADAEYKAECEAAAEMDFAIGSEPWG